MELYKIAYNTFESKFIKQKIKIMQYAKSFLLTAASVLVALYVWETFLKKSLTEKKS